MNAADGSAKQTIQLRQAVLARLGRLGNEGKTVATHLAEIHAAATAIVTHIDQLSSADAGSATRLRESLVGIREWLYEELADHATELRAPLDEVVKKLYSS
jgi:hypothetical protein